jgi:2-C-methyl-D-erythritol 4-phosphate cytidylyltransferase
MIFGSILAGGIGTRMDSHNMPKQFIDLCGKPIIIHTIEKMLAVKDFDYIFIAIHPQYREYLQNILKDFNIADNSKIIVIDGGKERIDTIQNVINAVYDFNHNENDIIVIHDAVRPFVSEQILLNSIKTANKYGACVAVTPAIDTMYSLDNLGLIVGFPNRKELFNGQAPDSFKLGILKSSFESLTVEEKEKITGTIQICSVKGYPIRSIQGDYKNIKITNENDLIIAEAILKKG